MRIRKRLRGLVPASHRGKVLVMLAGLMPMLIGGVAVSVDTAVIATARGQLQTVADAAALAGATQLATENRVRGGTVLSTEMAAARTQAIALAPANRVLTAPAVLSDNPSNATGGDVVVGYLDPSSTTSPLSTATQSLFNSVQVTAQRNAGHTGPVPSFFGNYFGSRGTQLSISATATVENATISGFKSVNGQGANLLPIVLDVATYYQMVTGKDFTTGLPSPTTDQYTFTPSTPSGTSGGTVAPGADGVTESQLYPVANGDPGNWGTINVGVTANSTSVLGDQIRYGITPAQLATFPNGTISLDQVDNTQSDPITGRSPLRYHTFSGDPGISAGIKDDLAAIIGKPVALPIYDQTGGNGNNATYRVVRFVGARILAVNFQGNPKYVVIQPALLNDATAIPGTPEPDWTYGGLIHLYLSR